MKRDGANQLRSGLRRELLEGHLPLSADNRAAVRRFNLKQLAVLTHYLYNPSTRAHFISLVV